MNPKVTVGSRGRFPALAVFSFLFIIIFATAAEASLPIHPRPDQGLFPQPLGDGSSVRNGGHGRTHQQGDVPGIPENATLKGRNLGFYGASWVRTNGRIVMFRNGYCFSIAPVGDISHPVAWDIPLPSDILATAYFRGVLQGDDAYLSGTHRIYHWNLADPAHPLLISALGDCHSTTDFADFIVKDNHPVIAGREDGIVILDPNDGGKVTIANTFPLPSGVHDAMYITEAGNLAIIHDGRAGAIGVYDLSDLKSPRILGSAPCPGSLYLSGFFYRAPHLIMIYSSAMNPGGAFSSDTEVAVYEFPDPSNPSTFNPIPLNAKAPLVIGGGVNDAAILGNRLYCATDSTVQVVDLSDPSAPCVSMGFDDKPYHPYSACLSVAVSEDLTFVADRSGIVAFNNNGETLGRRLITGSVVLGGYHYYKPFSLKADGTWGLVNLEREGVAIVDFHSGTPRRLGYWENTIGGNQGYLLDSVLLPDGSFGFVATVDDTPGARFKGGIQILDLKDPQNPIWVGTYQIPNSPREWFPTDLTLLHGRYLIAVMVNAVSQEYRLDILDLSDPTYPTLVGTYNPAPGTPIEGLDTLEVAGRSYALLACGQDLNEYARVQTLEITDPSFPLLRVDASTFVRGEAMSVAVSKVGANAYGYVPIYDARYDRSGVLVIDLSDPSNADVTTVTCLWNEPDLFHRFQVARPITSPWGPLLAIGSGWLNLLGDGSSSLWDLTISYCPRGTRYIDVREGPWWVSQVPGNASDLYLGLRAQGVGVASMLTQDLPRPIVLGPFDPPENTVITQPMTLSIHGVSASAGIAEVQFVADRGSCYYLLGKATAESDSGTYSVLFDPATLPEESVALFVDVYDNAGNFTEFWGGSTYDLSLEEPLKVELTASPDEGVVPLRVSLTAVISGGKPPYYCSWSFRDGKDEFAKGPSAEHSYGQVGAFLPTATVQDARYNLRWASVRVTVSAPPPPPGPAPVIQAMKKMSGPPFRLKVAGANFLPGCTVRVDEKAVPKTKVVNSGYLVAGSGGTLLQMCPKGHLVSITVLNPDGQQSAPVMFTR